MSTLAESLTLRPTDKAVIDAFVRQRPAESQKLSTDGKTLELYWMGGGRYATWKDGRVHARVSTSRSEDTVLRYLERKLGKPVITPAIPKFEHYHDMLGQENKFATVAIEGGKKIGAVQYSEFDGKWRIEMIEVLDEHRRRGVATALFKEIKRKHNLRKLPPSMLTDLGAKWRGAIGEVMKEIPMRANLREAMTWLRFDVQALRERSSSSRDDRWDAFLELYHADPDAMTTVHIRALGKRFPERYGDLLSRMIAYAEAGRAKRGKVNESTTLDVPAAIALARSHIGKVIDAITSKGKDSPLAELRAPAVKASGALGDFQRVAHNFKHLAIVSSRDVTDPKKTIVAYARATYVIARRIHGEAAGHPHSPHQFVQQTAEMARQCNAFVSAIDRSGSVMMNASLTKISEAARVDEAAALKTVYAAVEYAAKLVDEVIKTDKYRFSWFTTIWSVIDNLRHDFGSYTPSTMPINIISSSTDRLDVMSRIETATSIVRAVRMMVRHSDGNTRSRVGPVVQRAMQGLAELKAKAKSPVPSSSGSSRASSANLLGAATGQQSKFRTWMREVSREVSRTLGLHIDDLPDAPFEDWFEDGVSVKQAVARLKKL